MSHTMTEGKEPSRWRLKASTARMLVYLLILLGIAAWKYLPRPWHPTLVIETPHHTIYSTATAEQTQATAHALELLYIAYSNRMCRVSGFQTNPPPLKVRLFRNRKQFRWVNPGLGWAEAYYRPPYCRAYYAEGEANPFAWMLHEATHQLNHEVAHLQMAQWLEEGIAEYFSCSRLRTNELALGTLNARGYPLWWIDEMATSSDLQENLRNGSVIPLRAIVSGIGGPDMDDSFNLYYLHWLTLTHFLFETPSYRDQALALVERGGDLDSFEEIMGPVERVQAEWHRYVRRMKSVIERNDREFLKTGLLPQDVPNTE